MSITAFNWTQVVRLGMKENKISDRLAALRRGQEKPEDYS
jgi:hypothetical protein